MGFVRASGLAAFLALSLSGCITAIMATAALDAKLQCLSDPNDNPEPPRKRGEFPFRVVYEDAGVRHAIEDTQICQYKKRSCTIYGRDEIWESKLASDKAAIVIRQVDRNEAYLASLGSCRQMMSEASYHSIEHDPTYPAYQAEYENGRVARTSGGSWTKHALDKLGVKVVSFEQWSSESIP